MTETPNNPSTELRAIIKEDSQGNLTIDYQCYVAGTEVVIDMRPAHVAGKLNAGALLVLGQKYKLLETKAPEGNSKQEKKDAKRRRH